jgi:hypothetical protein
MKKITAIFVLLAIQTVCISQPYFQKNTTGQIATDVSSTSMTAWGDYNNDGFLDIVVIPWNDICWPCTYPILIYKNNGDGTFTREVNTIGQEVIYGNGAAWGDYDNDGKLDLYITRYFNSTNLLYHNEGGGNFTKVTNAGTIVTDANSSAGCSWGDYNKDGWIDMFVANGENQNDALYKNNGNGTFTRIQNDPIVLDGAESRSCSWGDYNNDGWPDMFVVTYDGENDMLYKNNGNGTFTRIFTSGTTNDSKYGSGCSWADYDRDGWLDLYVTNNNANNYLYHNEHNGTFTLSGTLPSFESGYSYIANWGDFDNDGWIDLFVPKRGSNTQNALFKNINGTGFNKILADVVALEGGASDAGAWGDYNNDGKLDLFVTAGSRNPLTPAFFYKNINTTGNFITLKLKGCTLNKSAIGARIVVADGNLKIMKEISGGNCAQNMLWQHFGLGTVTNVDSITVYWTTGNIQKLTNVPSNQILTIDECTIGIINNQLPESYSLKQNYPNPFNPTTQIEYSLLKSSDVKLTVYDVTGKVIKNLVNEYQAYGTYRIDFDGVGLSSGIYIYKIESAEFTDTKKMILIK